MVEQKWTKKGSCLLLAGNRNTLALPGSCVRLRPLPTYRKPRLVPPPPVALDVNEPGSSQLLSLDDFRIYTRSGSDPNPLPDSEADLDQLGILRYNLDTGEDSTILIDAGIVGSGSGASDLLAFVPVLSLEAAADDDYIYLYSSFGGYNPDGTDAWVNDSGFEEWSIPEDATKRPNVEPLEEPIPEPSTSLLLTVAAAALAKRRKR